MICELWITRLKDGTIVDQFFSPKENVDILLKMTRVLLEEDSIEAEPRKEWEVEADFWEEAMTEYHKHMGWKPYIHPC